MHFCTADVALANDEQQVVSRGPFNPISWPEIEVLRTIHGDEAVRNVKPFVWVEQDAKAEQQRLLNIYGVVVTEQDVLEPGTLWMNPITREVAPVPEVEEEVEVEEEDEPVSLTSAERAARRAEKKRLYNLNLRKREREAKAAAVSDEPTPEL
jgi:hypothetical protein